MLTIRKIVQWTKHSSDVSKQNKKNAALTNHAHHKQTQWKTAMPFKTLADKIVQLDLTREIANNHKRLHQLNQIASKPEREVKMMSKSVTILIT